MKQNRGSMKLGFHEVKLGLFERKLKLLSSKLNHNHFEFYFADDSKPAAIQTTNNQKASSRAVNLPKESFPSMIILLCILPWH